MHALQMMLDEDGKFETRSYSGRSMYGKECLAVTITSDIGDFLAEVIMATQSQIGVENIEEIAEAFRGMKTDSMGRGTVVYFPSISFEGDESDSGSEDEKENDDE